MKASKIAYKPIGMAMGAVSGVLAGAVFKQVWKRLGHEEDAPDATDEHRTWREVRFPTFAKELRLIDQDAYFVRTPGFDKCDASKPTMKCGIR
ncbi:DUF4235 domain-containing protein [Streptomyces sp. NBC_00299]|uniref:DUF4235 domain-containing protein n=1 Tax=Streptomyces sp. NBC_00299 TaxID=2975705 RepID=UPI002E2A180C|nr:DUF4235 domain-containing protein [Streptomyces sp. NBC_00299]